MLFHCKLFRDTPVDFFWWGGGGLWNLYGAGIYFQKFLNKPMQRERDFGGFNRKFHTPPPLKVNWTPYQSSFCAVADKEIDAPPTHPRQNKRHSGLRMKMKPNQDVRGNAKSERHDHAIAYARVYPEPSVSPSVQSSQSVQSVSL